MDFYETIENTLAFRDADTPYLIIVSSLVSGLGWAMVFGLIRVLTRARMSFLSSWRCVRFLQSVLIVIAADKALVTGSIPFVESGGRNTPYHNLILILSVGFMVFSAVCLRITKLHQPGMVTGYTFYIVYFMGNMFIQACGAEVMIGILVMETIAVLSQFREFLRGSFLSENGWTFKTLDWIYLLALLFIYLFVGTITFLLAAIDPYIHPFVKFGYLVSYVLCLKTVFHTIVYFKLTYFSKQKTT